MVLKKLNYDDAMMVETLVDTLNELIEENEYLHKRIDRLWKYVRVGNKKKKEKVKEKGGEYYVLVRLYSWLSAWFRNDGWNVVSDETKDSCTS